MTGQPTDDEVLAWRRGERQRLLAARLALPPQDRGAKADAICEHLDGLLGPLRGVRVGVYWPIKGEPGLRRWMDGLVDRGGVCAMPVVVKRAAPLVFRTWWPGAPMVRGEWGIPVPAEGQTVTPDVIVAPMVGFDDAGYRLGYGGGYYDRTLAALSRKPQVVGVAYAFSAMPTIHPLAHDVRMDCVITEKGIEVGPAWV